ncbi:GFA family protein [Pseudophaeobacter sp.]|uniref:GFA family protein n=1 Tax=Pseudophaeobacter sp. TaxID=1971739 RepID=UPI004059C539
MKGGCYCGALRYEITGRPVFKAQCHCRACQSFAGGAANVFMAVPAQGFAYDTGEPRSYRKPGEDTVATREFCSCCGTQVASRRDGLDLVMVKVGTLDEPAAYKGPKAAIYVAEKQSFHFIPEDLPSFEGFPPV